jgi:hypothetical protein
MGGTRTNIKLDTVIIAFQQCLDYNLLRLVFASLKEQVKIRNFAFDVESGRALCTTRARSMV